MTDPGDAHTVDGLLGGRIRYVQPRRGFRSGIEPVLLAAAIPARPGERVLEGGSGAGAGLLCLAARVAGIHGLGIEQDAALVSLAGCNAAANGLHDLRFVASDLTAVPPQGPFDHAFANPPYHPAAGTPSPDPARRTAKQAGRDLLARWAAALARPLRPRGTLTFVLPAASLPEATSAFSAAGCRPDALLPLWPRQGQDAKLLLLRGVKSGRSPFRILPGLILHTPGGAFTVEAEAILRGGEKLPF